MKAHGELKAYFHFFLISATEEDQCLASRASRFKPPPPPGTQ